MNQIDFMCRYNEQKHKVVQNFFAFAEVYIKNIFELYCIEK